MQYPECVKEASENVLGSFDDYGFGFKKEGSSFSKYEDEGDAEPEEDEWEYYCKVYGQEYMGWPPENDKSGFFTYAGQMVYFTSSEHGEMQDGDLPRDEFGMRI